MTTPPTNIFKALGIENLPNEQKARILDGSAELLQQRLILRLMESIPEAKRDRLNEILAAENTPGLEEFILQEAPDFGSWMIEESEKLRTQLMDLSEIDKI